MLRIGNMPRQRTGYSLIDLLVLAAIAGIVVTLVLIRLGGSRESSRRMECESNLRGVFLALESYTLRNGYFPIGTQNPTAPIRSEPHGYHQNWISGLLPMMNREDLYQQIDFDVGVYAPENASVALIPLPELMCPASAVTLESNATSYVGVTGSTERPIDSNGDGMFVLGRSLSQQDASDGVSFVFAIGEKSLDFGPPTQWNSGTRTSLRNAGHPINRTDSDPAGPLNERLSDKLFVGGFSSNHAGGAYFLLLDGSFRWFADETDPEVLGKMAGRSDNQPGGEPIPAGTGSVD